MIVAILAVAAAGFGIAFLAKSIVALAGYDLPPLAPEDGLPLQPHDLQAARVSILVPARNEADRILDLCIGDLLAQDHPHLEVVVTDDRSTDATPAILERLAAASDRLKVVSGIDPPPGWVGKVWALEQAYRAADGEIIISMDADMRASPTLVSKTLAAFDRLELDAISLWPSTEQVGFAEKLIMPTAGLFLFIAFPPAAANDPARAETLCVGGFIATRRATLEAIGAYAAIRDTVLDDVNTGRRLKAGGHRYMLLDGKDELSTRMYSSLREIWRGFSRNAFAAVGHDPLKAIGQSLALIGGVLAVLAALVMGVIAGPWWLLAAGLIGYLLPAIPEARLRACAGESVLLSLLWPLSFCFIGAIALNSTQAGMRGRKIDWRGRGIQDAPQHRAQEQMSAS